MKKTVKILSLLLTLIFVTVLVSCGQADEPEPARTEGWLASDGTFIQLYHGDETIEKNIFGKVKSRTLDLTEDIQVPRGTAVTLIDQPEKDEEGNVTYEKLAIAAKDENGEDTEIIYYIEPGFFVDDYQKTITETERFVRTSATVYVNPDDARIAGWARKGTRLDILGFNEFADEDHKTVDMYKVSYDGGEGYVFSKYLVDSQEEADAVYMGEVNGKPVAEWHKDAVYPYFDLYGGDPNKLDYYPVEKARFEGNTLVEDARTMRLSMWCSDYGDDFLQCAKDVGVNAVCIDLFDGILAYRSEVAQELCPTAYAKTYEDCDNFESMVKKFKDAGFYMIGRIVCFKDDQYAADHPEHCYYDFDGGLWPSAYQRDVWYYKVSFALEAIEKFGFDEIQFDYVRFDEFAWYKDEYGDGNYNSVYGEDKCEAVQGFLYYACDMIHRRNVYVSVDVFGESSYGYVTSYGQYWPAMSNIVDVISSMPYTDHFSFNDADSYLWENPYNTVYNWAVGAAGMQKTIPTPAIARTWITGWDVPYWNPYVYCGPDYLAAQAQALWDAGLTGGFIPWGQCEGWRYSAFSWAWTKDYTR